MMARILRSKPVSGTIVGQVAYADWRDTTAAVLERVLRAMADTGHAETAISILQRRMKEAPAEHKRWQCFALELVTNVDLIRCGGTPNHYWQQVASALVADHFEEIATAIFQAHSSRKTTESWFIDTESAVTDVLLCCVKQDPGRAWENLRDYLLPASESFLFAIGFPSKVMDLLPVDDILAWIAELPVEMAAERVAPLARMSNLHTLTDGTLAARLIGEYGDNQVVSEVFFSHYVSGSWWGPASSHWGELAKALNDVADRTTFSKLRGWASATARKIGEMSEQEQEREEEQELLIR